MKTAEQYVQLSEDEVARSRVSNSLRDREAHIGRAAVYAQLARVAQSAPVTVEHSATWSPGTVDDGHGPRETSR